MEESLNSTYESRMASEEERIRKELEAARVDKDIISKVVSKKEGTAKERLSQMQAQATTEVIGETVRQQSLKVIMKAVADRGFIVDKKNIKICGSCASLSFLPFCTVYVGTGAPVNTA